MSAKEAILRAIAGLPDSINWDDVANRLVGIVARDATDRDVARFIGSAFPVTAAELAELQNPPTDGMRLHELLAELEGSDDPYVVAGDGVDPMQERSAS